ncbi:hypothetical protein ACFQZ4_16970 [Catellatospora coxensis]
MLSPQISGPESTSPASSTPCGYSRTPGAPGTVEAKRSRKTAQSRAPTAGSTSRRKRSTITCDVARAPLVGCPVDGATVCGSSPVAGSRRVSAAASQSRIRPARSAPVSVPASRTAAMPTALSQGHACPGYAVRNGDPVVSSCRRNAPASASASAASRSRSGAPGPASATTPPRSQVAQP